MADNMIDLGRKPNSKAEIATPSANKPYYPSLMISTEEPIEFPDGEFNADVCLKLKRSEASEDENGNKRYSYTLDVCGIDPDFEEEAEEESEEGDDESAETDDAATSIMKAMGAARQQKMMAADDGEE